MPTLRIPSGTTISEPRPFSREGLEKALADACQPERAFTGFIAVQAADTQYLLFFFNGRPYGAAKVVAVRPSPLSIHGFLSETGRLVDSGSTFSCHATDPVLLKCLLVYAQVTPTATAPSTQAGLESLLEQIQQEAADALVIFLRHRMLNFFFFKNGTQGMAYFADTDFKGATRLSVDKQMLTYAVQGGESPIQGLVYRSLVTNETADAISSSYGEMVRVLRESPPASQAAPMAPGQGGSDDSLVLAVLDGPLKGQIVSGAIPCVIGRKDADIIVTDPLASKRHAAVQLVNSTPMLVDLDSTNGTIVNGRPIRQRAIQAGDIIGIGGTALKVVRITPL